MKRSYILILIVGVFSIINTEMGIVGILPMIADNYQVSISSAGLLVSLFALAVAISGPTMPLIFSGINRKKVMLLVLSIFLLCNAISAFTLNFTILLIARVIPAFFHPIYVSLAFSVAASSVDEKDAPKAVAKVMIGVSAGMVLGVPVISYIASITSLRMAMLSFAFVNAVVLIATIIFIPSLPVQQKLSYGSQLSVLKKVNTWISILAVLFLNGAIFGVYSFLSEYLKTITNLSAGFISLMLLIYGLANIIGNMIAGRLLSNKATRFIITFPFTLVAVYVMILFLGRFTAPMVLLILIWGILAGAGANINQYWITSAVSKSPDFANGLFLASTNLGTTIGTTVCGFFIAGIGVQSITFGGILFLIISIVAIFTRIWQQSEKGMLQK